MSWKIYMGVRKYFHSVRLRQRRRGAEVLKLIATVVLVFCGACFSPERAAQKKAEEIWQKHEEVFVDLREGKNVNAVDFDEACAFFYHLTQVEIPSDHNPFIDCYPTKDSYKALVPLQAWYSKNHGRLYWDEATKAVRLAPESK